MRNDRSGRRLFALVAALAVLASACGGEEDTAATTDSTIVSMDTASAGMAMTAAQDADQEFLREMTNHHQSLLLMAGDAAQKGGAEVKTMAQTLNQKQTAETQEMLAILQRDYNDSHQPMVMPTDQPMVDSLSQKSGADYDMAFQMNVVEHHRMGIGMVDQYLPRLTKPEIRTMAEKMKADQTKEIADIEAKMGH